MIIKHLKRVKQFHTEGCFIACLAMLKGWSYKKAFNTIHPYRMFHNTDPYTYGVGLSLEESIYVLKDIGLNPIQVKVKKISSLNKNALITIRWRHQPSLMHAMVYDKYNKKILDPGAIDIPRHCIENQIDSIFIFKNI